MMERGFQVFRDAAADWEEHLKSGLWNSYCECHWDEERKLLTFSAACELDSCSKKLAFSLLNHLAISSWPVLRS